MDKRFRHEQEVPLIDFAQKNRKSLGMERTLSCVADPEVSALEALKNHDHGLLCDLLTNEAVQFDVNTSYSAEKEKTLLHMAIEREDYESVRLILEAGANPNLINRILKTAPIHVAARLGNPHILQLLLSYPMTDANATTDDGKTALHILTKKCTIADHAKFFKCIELLLKRKGVNVNKADRAGDATPLSIAAGETRNLEVVRLLSRHGADLYASRDVINRNFGADVAKSLFEEANNFEHHMLADQDGGSMGRESLLQLLHEAQLVKDDSMKLETNWKQFDETVRLLVSSSSEINEAATGDKNVIQVAADYGLPAHIRTLLAFPGADPNFAGKGTRPPLILAARAGHYDVLKVLREHKSHNEQSAAIATTDFSILDDTDGCTVLHVILRRSISDDLLVPIDPSQLHRYEKCLAAILDDASASVRREVRSIINRKDTLGNTALHYATQLWPQSVVRRLLEFGANIGVKNIYDEVPVAQILPETMEDFLNDYCMKSEGNVTNENFKITFNFDFLVPPYEDHLVANGNGSAKVGHWTAKDAENLTKKDTGSSADDDDQIPLPETEGLWYMSQSKKHQHLLKHPVIAAFLFLKWQRMAPAYNKNLIFYIAFVSFLTAYIFAMFSGRSISDNGILFDACVDDNSTKNESGNDETPISSDITTLWFINVALLAILVLRELLQFGIAPRRYFFSFENLLEVTLSVLTAVLLFYGPFDCHISAKRQISAIIIVLSWSELITMIGRHPRLTVYNIYVTMFYKVSSTFIMFLAWYSCYIIAFGLGFYILLHKDLVKVDPDATEADKSGEADKEEEYIFFNYIGLSLVKTFTMFVGELEFGDLPIETTVGYLFLLAFIFLIVVVMMNLLNGLAVSDTGVIRQEAEIHSYKSQVGVVSYMESMMLGDPFNFLSNWPKYIWLKHVPTCSLVGGGRLYRVPPIRALFHTLTGARYVMLFHRDGLPDNQLTIHPNQDNFRCSILLPLCRCCRRAEDDLDLPEPIIESAKNLVIAQQRTESENQIVKKLESRLEQMEKLLMQLVQQK